MLCGHKARHTCMAMNHELFAEHTEAPSIIALTEPSPCGKYGPKSLQSWVSILGEITTASSCAHVTHSACVVVGAF